MVLLVQAEMVQLVAVQQVTVVPPQVELGAQDLPPIVQVCQAVQAEPIHHPAAAPAAVEAAEQVAPVQQAQFKSPLVNQLLNIITDLEELNDRR
jgi:hypothetical protein